MIQPQLLIQQVRMIIHDSEWTKKLLHFTKHLTVPPKEEIIQRLQEMSTCDDMARDEHLVATEEPMLAITMLSLAKGYIYLLAIAIAREES